MYNAFLKLDGITEGGSAAEIEILSFSMGASAPARIGRGSGGGAGKVSLNSITVLKHVDAASTSLFTSFLRGGAIRSGILTVLPAVQNGAQTYLKWEFSDILVSSMVFAGNEHGDVMPTEEIVLEFESIAFVEGSTTT